mmetsp:Transcript_28120/g.77655  ORF Transcript_28120/g.77655 Transcript_28120/m.77655 type:complete len:207 (-) Transcript_28120:455-1075(-)
MVANTESKVDTYTSREMSGLSSSPLITASIKYNPNKYMMVDIKTIAQNKGCNKAVMLETMSRRSLRLLIVRKMRRTRTIRRNRGMRTKNFKELMESVSMKCMIAFQASVEHTTTRSNMFHGNAEFSLEKNSHFSAPMRHSNSTTKIVVKIISVTTYTDGSFSPAPRSSLSTSQLHCAPIAMAFKTIATALNTSNALRHTASSSSAT